MAQGKTTTVKYVRKDNKTDDTTVNKTVEAVVIDNQLVPDPREINPGVIVNRV